MDYGTEIDGDDVGKVTPPTESMTMRYFVTKPSRWTFADAKVRRWVLSHCEGRVLNACAGKTKLEYDGGEIVRNDLNPEMDADTHVDVADIADVFEQSSFDTVLFDPPFSPHQAETKYDGLHVQQVATAKREFDTLLRGGGRVVQLGYTTTCMPGELGYAREEVAIFNTLGPRNDILGTVDKKLNSDIQEYIGES